MCQALPWQEMSPSSAQHNAALLSSLAEPGLGCLHCTCAGSLSSSPEVTSEANFVPAIFLNRAFHSSDHQTASYAQPKVSVKLGPCLTAWPRQPDRYLKVVLFSPWLSPSRSTDIREFRLSTSHIFSSRLSRPSPSPGAVSGQLRCVVGRSPREVLCCLFSGTQTPPPSSHSDRTRSIGPSVPQSWGLSYIT